MGGQAPQTLRPGEVWPPSGWSPVARMSGRRPRRSSPCPRPLSAVRMSVQSVTRTSGVHASGVHASGVHASGVHASGVHASGVHASGAIQVSGRTALRCPRLCSRVIRTALDPGMARCAGPSPLGAMGSRCRRGPRAAWSPARMGSDGKGWCWVGRGWLARGSTADLGRRIAGAQAGAPPRRLADKGAGPAPGCRSVGWGAREHPGAHQFPAGVSWAGCRRGA
jgi:hypothetical protein